MYNEPFNSIHVSGDFSSADNLCKQSDLYYVGPDPDPNSLTLK